MFKDLRKKKSPNLIIEVDNYELTCSGCPTIYDFVDTEGTNYDFYLRHGWATIECNDTGEKLISGYMDGFDGICNWTDVKDWATSLQLELR
ncbi:hypothetical protein MHB54_00645 [Paenibacillus sp. FSL M7-0802]|uniref:hypothetical protein n=1 Tax=Paenibacillus sp. FSL M7-0802 TaxID=2921536 RepID=UPI0030FB48D1